MKLAQDHGTATYRIRAYEPGWIQVNDTTYETSVMLMPDGLSTAPAAESFEQLTRDDLQPAIDWQPELLLLGTGATQRFPERTLMRALIASGIGFEAMTTAAACRTFNLLMSEDRRAAALLLLR